MNKKGAIAVIVGVLIIAGAIAAYSSNVLSPKSKPLEESKANVIQYTAAKDQSTTIQTVHIDKENKTGPNLDNRTRLNQTGKDGNVAQLSEENIPSSINNNTVIANNTLAINRPVYNNNTLIYQPVNININEYNTKIKQTLKISDNDEVTINNQGDILVNNKPFILPPPQSQKVPEAGSKSASDTSYTLTIRAARLPSDAWTAKFTDDHVGMFVSVYNLAGKQIKTGFADENGLQVTGLKNRLYFVYAADCDNCRGTKNDILFQKWEDGSKDRPRMIPANSAVTADYRLVLTNPEKQQQQPESRPTQKITIEAATLPATFVVGETVPVFGKITPFDSNINPAVTVQFFGPNGILVESGKVTTNATVGPAGWIDTDDNGDGFYRYKFLHGLTGQQVTPGQLREYMPPGKWVAKVTYADDSGARASAQSTFEVIDAPLTLSARTAHSNYTLSADNSSQQIVASINLSAPPDLNQKTVYVRVYTADVAHFTSATIEPQRYDKEQGQYLYSYNFIIQYGGQGDSGAPVIPGKWWVTAEYLPAELHSEARFDVTVANPGGEKQLSVNNTTASNTNESGTASSKIIKLGSDVSEEQGPTLAYSGNNVYAIWAGNKGIYLSSSSDGGKTFGNAVLIHKADSANNISPRNPVISASGDAVYVAWEEYDTSFDDLVGSVAFMASKDAAKTFGKMILLNHNFGSHMDTKLRTGTAGNVYVLWTDEADGEFAGKLLFRKSSDFGQTFGKVIEIKSASEAWNYEKAMAVSNNGTIYIAWQEMASHDPYDNPSIKVFFARSVDNGSTLSKPLQLNKGTFSNIQEIKVDSRGSIYALWTEYGDPSKQTGHSTYSLIIARSTDEGKTFGAPTVIAEVEDLRDASIAVSPEEEILVEYSSYLPERENGPSGLVSFQGSRDGGKTFHELNVTETGSLVPPARSGGNRLVWPMATASGQFFTAFNDVVTDFSGNIYLAQIGNHNDTISNAEIRQLTTTGAATVSDLIVDGKSAYVTWTAAGSSGSDAFVAVIALDNQTKMSNGNQAAVDSNNTEIANATNVWPSFDEVPKLTIQNSDGKSSYLIFEGNLGLIAANDDEPDLPDYKSLDDFSLDRQYYQTFTNPALTIHALEPYIIKMAGGTLQPVGDIDFRIDMNPTVDYSQEGEPALGTYDVRLKVIPSNNTEHQYYLKPYEDPTPCPPDDDECDDNGVSDFQPGETYLLTALVHYKSDDNTEYFAHYHIGLIVE